MSCRRRHFPDRISRRAGLAAAMKRLSAVPEFRSAARADYEALLAGRRPGVSEGLRKLTYWTAFVFVVLSFFALAILA